MVEIEGYQPVPAEDSEGNPIENAYWYEKQDQANVFLGFPCALEIPNRQINVAELNLLRYQQAWAGIAIPVRPPCRTLFTVPH